MTEMYVCTSMAHYPQYCVSVKHKNVFYFTYSFLIDNQSGYIIYAVVRKHCTVITKDLEDSKLTSPSPLYYHINYALYCRDKFWFFQISALNRWGYIAVTPREDVRWTISQAVRTIYSSFLSPSLYKDRTQMFTRILL